jgi:hypothetical protein
VNSADQDLRKFDLVGGVRDAIARDMESIKASIAEDKRVVEVFEQVAKRISRKAEGENQLSVLITNQIRDRTRNIAAKEEALRVGVKARALAEEYQYDWDKPPPRQAPTPQTPYVTLTQMLGGAAGGGWIGSGT